MPLVRDGAIVADPWLPVPDDAALPEEGGTIVSLRRWKTERETLAGRNAPLGLSLANTDEVEEIGPEANRFGVIVLSFPKFSDGRAYSQARMLRERYGFKGELRATGAVLPDQLVHMLRCGFDAFVPPDDRLLKYWDRVVASLPAFYQPIGRVKPTVGELRSAAASKPAAA